MADSSSLQQAVHSELADPERKTLVLMRHGETLFNQKHRIQGVCDAPLTRLGRAQAEKAAQFVHGQNIDFDLWISSPSERACDTLEIVYPDQPYTRVTGIKEMDFGTFEGEPEIVNPPLDSYSEFFKAAGGETREEAGKRMYETLRGIMDQPEVHQVLAVSHGGAMKNFARLCDVRPGLDVFSRRFQNCCVLVMDYFPASGTFEIRDLYNEPFTATDLEKYEQAAAESSTSALPDQKELKDAELRQERTLPLQSAQDEKNASAAGMKKLILMRHGQTLFNAKKMVQGWADSPLTPTGRQQAQAARKDALPYVEAADHLYSSTSERASQTLEEVTDRPYRRLKGLKECCYGIFEGENMLMNFKDIHFALNEAKNPYEARNAGYKRFEDTVRSLMEQPDHQQVFIVSHGDVIYGFGRSQPVLEGLEGTETFIQNCGLMIFDYNPDTKEFLWTDYINPEGSW